MTKVNELPIDEQLQNEYEVKVLSMLISGKVDKQEHILKHTCFEMFTNKPFQELYKNIVQLKNQKTEINVGNLCEIAKKEHIKKLTVDINKEYITAANCNYYIEKLQNHYLKKLLKECESFAEYKKVEEIKKKYEINSNVKPISYNTEALIMNYFDNWENPIKTFFPSIDERIGSLQGGDILILAGATGMGKTCMMLNLVMSMAKNKLKVLLFSLEMTLSQLQNRIISAELNIDSIKVRNFEMTDEERIKYDDFVCGKPFQNLDINVCTDYDLTIDKLRDTVLANEADVIFIDYLGLIKSDIKGNAYERVSEISRDLKLLALESNKPFIVLHQLNRIPPERKEKRPLLSDLRDSGKIEQDADFICFVYRDSYYNDAYRKDETETIEFILEKSRHSKGQKKTWLKYNGAKQKITDPKQTTKNDYIGRPSTQCSFGL